MAQRTVPSGGFHKYLTRSESGSRRTARGSAATIIRGSQVQLASTVHYLKSTLQIVDRQPAPALLPILRSQQQGEILALLLGDPDLELSLTEIAARTGAPHPSVYREIQRNRQPGHLAEGRQHPGSSGPTLPALTTAAWPNPDQGIRRPRRPSQCSGRRERDHRGLSYGSWAARHEGQPGQRPVGDIDVLILGEPDRDQLYTALGASPGAPGQTGTGHHPRHRLAGVRIRRLPRTRSPAAPWSGCPCRTTS